MLSGAFRVVRHSAVFMQSNALLHAREATATQEGSLQGVIPPAAVKRLEAVARLAGVDVVGPYGDRWPQPHCRLLVYIISQIVRLLYIPAGAR